MIQAEQLTPWQGTLSEALDLAERLVAGHQIRLELPLERTIRDWRKEEVFTRSGRKFTGRNVLELLRTKQLRDQQVPLHLIREAMKSRSDAELLDDVLKNVTAVQPATHDDGRTERTVLLLAHAILKQFAKTKFGKLVGIYADLPVEIRQAQGHLARLYMQSGEEDITASVHQLLHFCTRPMGEWAPKNIREHPDFGDVVLIDPDLHVPSDDCELLGEKGGHLEDLVENQLHQRFKEQLDKLYPEERPQAYTLIRQFIAEHPMTTVSELQAFTKNLLITDDLHDFLDDIYPSAHAADASHGKVARCGHCKGPLREGRCRLPSCRTLHPNPLTGNLISVHEALIARPEILRYWCDPAQEELRLYSALKEIHGDLVELYPHSDACDVSLGQQYGVDVKDHRSPVGLAQKLNNSIGGLSMYSEKILAVATRRAQDPNYIPRLREQLTPALRNSLQVMGVSEAIQKLSKVQMPHG